MNQASALRTATASVVTGVAGFAAVISYSHIKDLGASHGQTGAADALLPLSVDGLIVAASLVMLHEAQHGRKAPVLARWMLALGVAATVAANVAYGLSYGPVGALFSAWPAVAFIGAAEMLFQMITRSRVKIEDIQVNQNDQDSAKRASKRTKKRTQKRTPVTALDAEAEFLSELRPGKVPSLREIQKRMRVGQAKAMQFQEHLASCIEAVGSDA